MDCSLITFIIPVYNVNKYLDQCLDSILGQTYSGWECILVDDGSIDASGKVCDKYAALDSRIRVIHKENGGVSSARNLGISNAKTPWISFIDADDTIASDYISQFLPIISEDKYRAITISAVRMTDNGVTTPYTSYNDEEVSIDFFVKKVNHFVSWGYFFDLSIIRDNNLRFNTTLAMSEDAVFILQYFQYIPSIYTLSARKYYYRVNDDSVVQRGMNYQKSLNFYNAALQIHCLKEKNLLSPSAIDTSVRYQLRMFLRVNRKMYLNKEEHFDLQKKLSDLRYVIDKCEKPKLFQVAAHSFYLYKIIYKCYNTLLSFLKDSLA